ncbi:hypothetical protein Tco_0852852 [Tanacetum coccineum]
MYSTMNQLLIGVFNCMCAYAHRKRVINWINATGGTSSAFDVTTKTIIEYSDALQGTVKLGLKQGLAKGTSIETTTTISDNTGRVYHYTRASSMLKDLTKVCLDKSFSNKCQSVAREVLEEALGTRMHETNNNDPLKFL